MASCKKIGVFDSGVGGLTVLYSLQRAMGDARFYYLGDNFRAPYGSRPKEEILAFTRAAMKIFADIPVDAAVLACNTATAVCAEVLRGEFPFPILGMEPAIRPAAKCCRRALVLCTPRTAESTRLKKLIAGNPACEFVVFPAEGLAGEIERALSMGETPDFVPFIGKRATFDPAPDGIVLGCTHYVFLKKELSEFYAVPAFDGNEGTAKHLQFIVNKFDTQFIVGSLFQGSSRAAPEPVFIGNAANLNKRVYENARFLGIFEEK